VTQLVSKDCAEAPRSRNIAVRAPAEVDTVDLDVSLTDLSRSKPVSIV
jgi:hypothetical protein